MGTLTNRVAVVTGGGGGLGYASSLALAQAGASVAVVDINEVAAGRTAQDIIDAGGRALALRVDLSHECEIASAVARIVSQWRRLDIVHNNAADMSPEALSGDTTVLDLNPEIFGRIFRVNVVSYALMAKHAIPHMIAQGGGVIINTASVTGHSAEMERVMYGTTKSAIHGLTRNIATQHGKDAIRCVSISPGVILTPGIRQHMSDAEITMFTEHNALPRAGTAEDVGGLVAFLASDAAGFMSGTDIVIDGGLLAHFPTVVDQKRLEGKL